MNQFTLSLLFLLLFSLQASALVPKVDDPNFLGFPCPYPMPQASGTQNVENHFFTYYLNKEEKKPNVDGFLTKEDGWQEPFFKIWTEPMSHHPDGYTYGYLKNDGEYLYGAIDYTSDNTIDGIEDFAALLIKTDAGWKHFPVSLMETKWGKTKFAFTDKVSYQHSLYEFKIPLLELMKNKSSTSLRIAFLAYGTSTCPTNVTISDGSNNPTPGTQFLGDSSLETVLYQIKLSQQEGIPNLDTITLTSSGTGNDATDIESIQFYLDANRDGALDSNDTLLATSTYTNDNGTVQLDLTEDGFPINSTSEGLIVYKIKSSTSNGATYQVSLASNDNVTTEADSTCATAIYTGAPVTSSVLTVSFGSTTLTTGSVNPSEAVAGSGQTNIPMLQFTIAASSEEGQNLTATTLTASGTGDESTLISAAKLWDDADNSGTVTDGDTQLGLSQTFPADNGTITFSLSSDNSISASSSKNYLVTYDFSASSDTAYNMQLFEKGIAWIKKNPVVLFPPLYPFTLQGCGSSKKKAAEVVEDNLPILAEGLKWTDGDGTTITSADEGSVILIKTTDDSSILKFTMGSSSLTLTNASFLRSSSQTLVALGNAASELPESLTVFIPCDADDNNIRICPSQTTTLNDNFSCTGKIRLTNETAKSGYTWSNADAASGDCEITGSPSSFTTFLGEGVTSSTFSLSLSSTSNLSLTGESSSRTTSTSGSAVSGNVLTLISD